MDKFSSCRYLLSTHRVAAIKFGASKRTSFEYVRVLEFQAKPLAVTVCCIVCLHVFGQLPERLKLNERWKWLGSRCTVTYQPYNILPHTVGNVKELGIVVSRGDWCFVTSCDVVYVCNPLILKECSKVPLFQRYMSKSEKGFLGQRPSLLLSKLRSIYI